jgi:hypothetical protein|tara:strand:- start:1608 stop:1805 length:198 start_codon:yes stop_codon:yes gene_type:complete
MIKNLISKLFCSQDRVSWRRITVFGVSTVLLLPPLGVIDAATWATIALAYIAGDSAEKALAAFKR